MRSPVFLAANSAVLAVVSAAWTAAAVADCPPLVSRDEAKQFVIDNYIVGHPQELELVAYSYPSPLPPGSSITPYALGEEVVGDFETVVAECSWFFYLNLTGEEKFAHEVAYAYVSGSPGAPTMTVTDHLWWPVLDGAISLYEDPAANETSPDRFYGPTAAPSTPIAIRPGSSANRPAAAVEKLWAISFRSRGIYNKDRRIASEMVVDSGGVPADNSKTFEDFDRECLDAAVSQANDNDASCVYAYVSTHITRGTRKMCTQNFREYMTRTQFADALDELNACSVYVIIDGCYSGHFIPTVLNALKAREVPLNEHDPAACAVLTSASSTKESQQREGGDCEGSYWTQALKACWADPNADGADPGASVDILEAAAWVKTNGGAKANVGDPQDDDDTRDSCSETVAVESHTWGKIKTLYAR